MISLVEALGGEPFLLSVGCIGQCCSRKIKWKTKCKQYWPAFVYFGRDSSRERIIVRFDAGFADLFWCVVGKIGLLIDQIFIIL